MGEVRNSTTSLTLLARLRSDPADQRGWEEFVERYGPKIESWCRGWGCQEADARDVTQNVLLALSKQMQRFEYKPGGRFRSWLRTVARRAWVDFLRNRERVPITDDALWQRLESEQISNELLQRLEDEADRELLELAMDRVKARVKSHTWEAFFLTTYEGLTAMQAAERLKIQEGSVFVARHRIQQMLMAEVEKLDCDAGGDEDARP